TKFPMEFIGGIVGIENIEGGAVRGAFGWAIKDEAVMLTSYPLEYMTKDMEITSPDGEVGKLKVADATEYSPGDRRLSEVQIEWGSGIKTHTSREFKRFYVKTPTREQL